MTLTGKQEDQTHLTELIRPLIIHRGSQNGDTTRLPPNIDGKRGEAVDAGLTNSVDAVRPTRSS